MVVPGTTLTATTRYRLYALAHGKTPERQYASDALKPQGAVVAFADWLEERKKSFAMAHPDAFLHREDTGAPNPAALVRQDDFDQWLTRHVSNLLSVERQIDDRLEDMYP